MIEQVKTELAKKGIDNYFSEEQLDKMMDDSIKYGRIFSPIIMLIGGGIAFGGFALYKRGKKMLNYQTLLSLTDNGNFNRTCNTCSDCSFYFQTIQFGRHNWQQAQKVFSLHNHLNSNFHNLLNN